ncbi:DUF1992 domain-containing protein [Paenibacillus allorhizosphaerae]|uniref:DnaJ homologue subfamily C member 28 conserved domain-containing protein n=1 Tax=Paenibacillus allorhizosphaerae TaxID=2849866 RepID=A0ABN7TDH6_9BACL|nr:DUF1992 domain-containing protein [Paenibacillus allorhizosphaerae]CAG7625203.1 hypothetical protein PAECIP111802_01144 [Paenibacillus allorhizosphaerae]
MFRRWRSKKSPPYHAPEAETALPKEQAAADTATNKERANHEQASADDLQDGDSIEAAPVPPKFRKYGADWMDEVMQDQMEKGNLDHLPGEGKPLFLTGESSIERHVNSVLKTANYLPRWVELQQEIKHDLERILKKKNGGDPSCSDIQADISEVNQKIRKFNDTCPIPLLQKTSITEENIAVQYEKWK